MDQLQTRLEAMEYQVQTLHQQTRTIKQQLRWWRSLAGGLLMLAVLTWALPVVTADEAKKDLEQRVAALEELLKHFRREGNEVTIQGANLRLVNGLGRTDCGPEEEPIPDCPNGLGNLIVGYNEPRPQEGAENIRTGSHNVVVGQEHNFSRVGGLVVGARNMISGDFASVSGGDDNTASGDFASVSGGSENQASDISAVVSGGEENRAIGGAAVVSGGLTRRAEGRNDWVAGSLFEDE
jgi:hypothetical protein